MKGPKSHRPGPKGIVPRAVQPYSEECERAVLACFLLNPEKVGEFIDDLQVEDFYLDRHQKIYRSMNQLDRDETPIDLRTLQAVLEDRGCFQEIGGHAYLAGLDLDLPAIENLPHYIKVIKTRSNRRRLSQLCRRVDRALCEGELEFDAAIDDLSDNLQKLSAEDEFGAKRGYRSVAEILKDPSVLEPPRPALPRLAWRGRTTLLASREKAGKSTISSFGACCITERRPFLGEPCPEGTILWVGLEEHESDFVQRLVRFELDADRFYVCNSVNRTFHRLDRYARETKPLLIVVDTLAALVEGWVDDPHKSTAWTPIMQGLTRIARRSDAGMLLVHHARKSDGSYRDSTAIGAGVDVILEMRPDERDPNIRHLKGKGRFPVPETSVRFDGEGFELCSSLPGPDNLDTRILSFVTANPGASKRQVRDAVSGKAQDISQAIDRLVANHQLENRGKGLGFSLFPNWFPEEGREPLQEPLF